MLKIVYPPFPFKIKQENNTTIIFDEIRKKWVILTPEEWVRQNFIQYTVQVKKYPPAVIAVEKEIKLGELKKRCDIVVYRSGKPWMIIECKEKDVALNAAVVEQVLRYNIKLQVRFLVITNGETNYAVEVKDKEIKALDYLPEWNDKNLA